MAVLFRRVAIVGVGMVGGSLGRAMLSRGLVDEVVGIDATLGAVEQALGLGAITAAGDDLSAVSDADLVILATPVNTTLRLLPELSAWLKAGAVVTDVCSTKADVVSRALEVLPDDVVFVGGHPMAGSEKQGVTALDENLFENAIYVLTVDESPASEKMAALVRGLGAVPLVMDAQKHDRLVAAISHLPHLVATALVSAVAGMKAEKNELLALAAGGFRDTTRVALGNPEMWKDICLTNRENILALMDQLMDEMMTVRRMVAAGAADGLTKHFREARDFRLQVPSRGKGILPTVSNLYVYVPDKPGIIGEVAGLLGDAGINIAEIELLRVREEEGGPLRLGFGSEEKRLLAVGILAAQGFRVQMQEG